MSFTQKDLIIAYREEGLSYQEIAEKTHTSIDYCRTVWSRANHAKKQHKNPDMGLCRYCGKLLVNLPGAKPKQFCSDKCRNDYHNHEKMRKAYILNCKYCGNEFVSIGYPKKLYCSHDCLVAAARKAGERHE